MVRIVDSLYQFWLAGYYDDFMGARAIADDGNSPSITSTYDEVFSHHGNPMNGEATLNPRFRWCKAEIEQRTASNYGTYQVAAASKFIANSGEYAWVTSDDIRNQYSTWAGKAQMQYPDGIANANRQCYDGLNTLDWARIGPSPNADYDAQGGIQRFVNGYRTVEEYIVGTGDTDSTRGRGKVNNISQFNHRYDSGQAVWNGGTPTARKDYQCFAHLSGCWMGERIEAESATDHSTAGAFHDVAGGTHESPYAIFAPVKSPGGKPFLQLTSYHGDTSSSDCRPASKANHNVNIHRPVITYGGTLNSRGDGDTFTVRFAARSFTGYVLGSGSEAGHASVIEFYAGFSNTLSPDGDWGYDNHTNTAAIEWTVDLTDGEGIGGISYDYLRRLYTRAGGNTKQTNNTDDNWIDLDFVIDYTNNRYSVWCNGTQVTDANTLAGSSSGGYYTLKNNNVTSAAFTPAQMKGWCAMHRPAAALKSMTCVLMLDRVGLIRPLTDAPEQKGDGWDMPPINEMKMTMPVDGISNLQIKLQDDPGRDGASVGSLDSHYGHQLTKLFSQPANDDWMLLMFADDEETATTAQAGGGRIDRPVWRGFLDKMKVQDSGNKKRTIQLNAKDILAPLDRQVPLWELGQGALNDSESATAYWTDAAAGWNEVFYMGTNKLKMFNSTIGFDKDDNYLERTDQRTQLGSGHPIQMYNNESASGPNSIEEAYEGYSVYGIGINTSGHTMAVLVGNPGYTTSSDVYITNTANHNLTTTQQPSAVGTWTNPTIVPGDPTATHQFLTFDGSSGSVLAYTREAPLIVYAGGFYGQPWTDATGDTEWVGNMMFHFDADPTLDVGDRFFIPDGAAIDNTRPTGLGDGVVGGFYTVRNKGSYTRNNVRRWRIVVHDDERMSTFSEGHASTGQYNDSAANGYLTGNARIRWTKLGKESGTIRPITNNLVESKAVHAIWMRDLPKSVWFQYHFGQIANEVDASGTTQAATTTATTTIQIDATSYAAISGTGGLGEIVDSDGRVDTFTWKAKAENGGDKYLIGVQNLSRAHDSGSTVNILTVSDDYKHCWLLWADMRNNGKADAEAGFRKNNFGLLYPVAENYDVSMFYSDQVISDTKEPDRFASLKLGSDVDLWEISALTDPSTGGEWSHPCDYANLLTLTSITDNGSGKARLTVASSHLIFAGYYVHIIGSALHDGVHKVSAVGSTTLDLETTFAGTDNAPAWGYKWGKSIGSEIEHRPGPAADRAGGQSENTVYRDWEDKAGAFIVIDSAKFFNLNTLANGGKSGQDAGGNTDLEDYIASVRGFPKLIDNYWSEGIASWQTVTHPYAQHPNATWCMSDGTTATNTIMQGDPTIMIKDGSKFPYRGWGEIVAESSSSSTGTAATTSSNASTRISIWIYWSGCIGTEITGTMTSGTNTVAGSGATETRTLVDSSGNFIAKGIIPGMVVQNNNTSQAAIVREVTNATTLKVYTAEATTAFGVGHTYKFSPQLSNIRTLPAGYQTAFSGGNGWSPSQILEWLDDYIDDHLWSLYNNGAPQTLTLNTAAGASGGYDKIEVYNTIASKFMLRLMMHIDGYVRSEGCGTYWQSDKMRALWCAGMLDSWMPRTNFPCVFDINNVPQTFKMTTDGTASNSDSFGSITDMRSKTILGSVRTIKQSITPGYDNDTTMSFSYLMGRDGRLELRPNYNSGWTINRDNSLTAKLDADIGSQVSHVRVYYNGGLAFADHPIASTSDTTKWKIIDMPSLISHDEAEAIAKTEFNRTKESRLKVDVEMMRDLNTTNKMLTGARYGYIADPTRMVEKDHNVTHYQAAPLNNGWDSLMTGGMPFPGMCNALDGNMATVTDINHKYGQTEQIDTTTTAAHEITWDESYYWYGANSISYAVQIVHIGNGVPKVSATTGEELRVWVALKNGQSGTDIDNAEFLIGISDCSYSTTVSSLGGAVPHLEASLATNGFESVVAKGSGFYEIEVPTSYYNVSPQSKIVVSFNAEYCKSLLRHRCGDPTASGILHNSHNISEVMGSTWAATSANSIFPIGMRKFTNMSSFAYARAAWYAPRIHIVNDLNFTPATTVTYTNKSHDLNNQTLAIQRVEWQISGRNIERVKLNLERDESRYSGGLGAYLFPTLGDTSRTSPAGQHPVAPPPPAAPPERQPPDGRPQGPAPPDLEPQNPWGGGSPSVGSQTGSGSGHSWNINHTTAGLHGTIKKRMDMGAATVSDWGILGQNRPDAIPSSFAPVEGLDFDIKPQSGMAVKTDDGFALPGKGHPDETGYQQHSITTTVTVPSDAIGESIGVSGVVSCAPDATGDRNSVIIVKAECIESGNSVTETNVLMTGVDKASRTLINRTVLAGMRAGRTVKVTITRKPGATSTLTQQLNDAGTAVVSNTAADNANEDSVVVHDLIINFNRSSVPNNAKGTSGDFGLLDFKTTDNS